MPRLGASVIHPFTTSIDLALCQTCLCETVLLLSSIVVVVEKEMDRIY